ncbi:hypothetical protein OPV22_020334 [Ensete ventricosum]|uniref:Uncharacterized protein n=1 Tax=Ensete ventricosum TaxID=4639 RepID=A0AAV8QEG1_ENSVE|nr:hypothetical protein OPV22_020334 [Ensete ventricosum]
MDAQPCRLWFCARARSSEETKRNKLFQNPEMLCNYNVAGRVVTTSHNILRPLWLRALEFCHALRKRMRAC